MAKRIIDPFNLLILGGLAFGGVFLATRPNVFQQQVEKQAGTSLIGEPCGENTDCSTKLTVPGAGGSLTSAVGCCNGTCQVRKQTGVLGSYVCREAGDKIPEIETQSLKSIKKPAFEYETKDIGSSCTKNLECSGTGIKGAPPNENNVKCCNNQCKLLRKDYLGIKYCPEECKKSLFDPPGSCEINTKNVSNSVSIGKTVEQNVSNIETKEAAGKYVLESKKDILGESTQKNIQKQVDALEYQKKVTELAGKSFKMLGYQ